MIMKEECRIEAKAAGRQAQSVETSRSHCLTSDAGVYDRSW
jgi:hypothetical protein